MDTRKKVFFCNLAIIVLCVASILSYFLMPFWKVKVSYTLSADMFEDLLPSSGGESSASDDLSPDDVYSNLDFGEIIGEDGVTLNLSIALKTSDILSSLSSDANILVENIIEENVSNLISQMDGTINSVVRKTVTSVVKNAFAESIKEEVKKTLGAGTTDSKAKEELEAAGLDDAYLDKKTNELVDIIYTDGTTSAIAANATLDIVEESLEMMKQKDPAKYADMELTEEKKDELRETLLEKFQAFENSDGTLDPEAFTTDFLLEMLEGETSGTSAVLASPVAAKPGKTTSTNDDAAKLRDALTKKLLDLIGGAGGTIAMVVKILSYVIIATLLIWLLPILKILLKLKKENNAIRVGLPIWLGSLPYVLLCLLPGLALKILKNPPAALAGSLGNEAVFGSLSITFTSCAIVSFIAGIVLAVLVIAFYGKQRKLLKSGDYVLMDDPDRMFHTPEGMLSGSAPEEDFSVDTNAESEYIEY